MATLICRSTASDLSGGADFDNVVSEGIAGVNTDINVSVAASAVETSYFYTPAGYPNNDAWGTNSMTLEVRVNTKNSNIDLRVRASRINSTGTVQESSSWTAKQTLNVTGVFNYSIPSTAWTGGACGDRLRIDCEFTNNDSMMSQTVVIGSNTADQELVTSISVNSGGCAAASTFIPKVMFIG